MQITAKNYEAKCIISKIIEMLSLFLKNTYRCNTTQGHYKGDGDDHSCKNFSIDVPSTEEVLEFIHETGNNTFQASHLQCIMKIVYYYIMYSAAMLKVFIRVLMAVEFHILYILICAEKKFEIYRIIFEQKFDF